MFTKLLSAFGSPQTLYQVSVSFTAYRGADEYTRRPYATSENIGLLADKAEAEKACKAIRDMGGSAHVREVACYPNAEALLASANKFLNDVIPHHKRNTA